ncbi:MAG: thiamine phosphate synthase [Bryobacteraceae bacterium]|nr:thiamine phosphate synthase [Bryobacteraceae bacterium]
MSLSPVYAIVDGDVLARRGLDLVTAAEALLEGGVTLMQLRWKGHYSAQVYQQAVRIAELTREAGATFVVNDRADIAALLNAGVHIGQDDLPPADVRRVVGPDTVIGISTHNAGQFEQAIQEPVSYIALGPIYGTISKERPDPVVGITELALLRQAWQGPLVAIGGITRERAPEVWRSGADSVAIIGDLYPEQASKSSVRDRAEEWMRIANEQSRR